MNNLNKLVVPQSVALIGASSHPGKVGYQILDNIVRGGYLGQIFPVNPKGGEIIGKKVYVSIDEIGQPIDLAIIAIPQKSVLLAVKDCIAAGVKNLIIISAGFSESGPEGKEIEDQIVSLCQQNDVTLIGPNCFGLINTAINLNATFAKCAPSRGGVSFISQSGAIISSMISMSSDGIGFSKVFSLGNKAMTGEEELLQYLYSDPDTKVVICYLESLKVTPNLTQILVENSKKKPTIVLFGGKSAFGARAARSHTGSVVSSYIAIRTYLEQVGVVLVDDIEDLLLRARVFSSYTKISGPNITVITNAGGPAIATSDSLALAELSLAKLNEQTISMLSDKLRPEVSLNNPVDLLGDASAQNYADALDIVGRDENTDAILLLLTPQTTTNIYETALVVAGYNGSKPLLSSFVGGEILAESKELIEKSGKPCFSYPEEAVWAIDSLVNFSKPIEFKMPEKVVTPELCPVTGQDVLLDKYGLPVMSYSKVMDLDSLLSSANSIGYPVVLKVADNTGHKSDAGGVITGIKSEPELVEAANKIGFPAVVGKMIRGKFELILGIKKDESVGTTILFGTGGIYSDIYADFAYAIAPLTPERAKTLIMSTKIGRILAGVRGQKPYDLNKLAGIIISAVTFADTCSNIKEVDFNPVIVTDDGFEMVDVRIITTKMDNELCG